MRRALAQAPEALEQALTNSAKDTCEAWKGYADTHSRGRDMQTPTAVPTQSALHDLCLSLSYISTDIYPPARFCPTHTSACLPVAVLIGSLQHGLGVLGTHLTQAMHVCRRGGSLWPSPRGHACLLAARGLHMTAIASVLLCMSGATCTYHIHIIYTGIATASVLPRSSSRATRSSEASMLPLASTSNQGCIGV